MRANEFIIEAREDFIADQLGDKLLQAYNADHGQKPELSTPLDVVNELARASKKAIQWLANRYVAGEFKLEDLSAIKQALERFNQAKAKLQPDQKDLNKLSLGDLYRLLAPFEKKDVSSNKEKDKQKKEKFMSDGDAELIYKDSSLVVLTPKTEEASCYFGKGTKWCTAASQSANHFDDYNTKGPLYIIMTKNDGKFQLHLQKREFNNAVNEELGLLEIQALIKKYPKLYNVFGKQAIETGYLPLIKNPSEEVQVFAVKQNGTAIQYIKNPSEEVQLRAVQQNGTAIKYIKNPSEEVQLAAVRQYGYAIQYIKNPSEKVQLRAVQKDGYAIQYIKNPSEKVKQAARKSQ